MTISDTDFQVAETCEYDNLIDDVAEYEQGFQPFRPVKEADFPYELKVHVWRAGEAQLLARTLNKRLSSDRKKFVYKDGVKVNPERAVFVEKRKNPITKKTSHLTRTEAKHWKNTLEFSQTAFVAYITFTIVFKTADQLAKFSKRVKQRITLNTPSINFPTKRKRAWRYKWMSQWDDCNPKYPVYIVSKGRADTRLTANTFERCNIPYFIAIEPQDYDEYACLIDPKKILVLPFSNHGDGPGRARNWCWDHSMSLGFKRHWVCDDNIDGFMRLHKGRRHPIGDGGLFRVIEEFVDRYKNVPIAGPQYRFHALESQSYPPFVLNTRIYSCLLIENSCKHRWRGRYNEDTILSLDVLKEGDCTMLFNCLLQNKIATQAMKGGNTDEFYSSEGTYNKSLMLQAIHPDVSKVKWKYNRWHHEVDYLPFKGSELKFIDGYDPLSHKPETAQYSLERIRVK